ncbi:hydroxymethylpyrimidine/phosphomethylpyrimidine kinase [Desulfurobacterium pacificum]|uniref:Hydroxymethylpyrimidine/phosphomethylpyrimidine kinase n=1 Tax=Desulfurobacterium pacificum TaxID=240166 RepID=A0ABY1NIZ9_9BACT|nr:bifunctional hydroxymethylpyrimidine kinase/phosphomethylpyrimidine kinase [Desulfurobacterium pacificum]SMP10307.1 hydroxymethylpyrimidine/phosphomethylpyrimidine kinase [Desulfurobacterium pacificum]
MKFLLTVAGFDPTGGAGILRDLAIFRRFGFLGAAAITANTVQNTGGVRRVEFVEGGFLIEHLKAVLEEIKPFGVKIGIPHSSAEINSEMAKLLGDFKPIVFDPVVSPTFGKEFLSNLEVIRPLLSVADVITPNFSEYRVLKPYLEDFKGGVIVKGVVEGERVKDLLMMGGEILKEIVHVRDDKEVRGTGCAFSSALLSLMCLGEVLEKAFVGASSFLETYRKESFKTGIMKQWYSFV